MKRHRQLLFGVFALCMVFILTGCQRDTFHDGPKNWAYKGPGGTWGVVEAPDGGSHVLLGPAHFYLPLHPPTVNVVGVALMLSFVMVVTLLTLRFRKGKSDNSTTEIAEP